MAAEWGQEMKQVRFAHFAVKRMNERGFCKLIAIQIAKIWKALGIALGELHDNGAEMLARGS